MSVVEELNEQGVHSAAALDLQQAMSYKKRRRFKRKIRPFFREVRSDWEVAE